MDAEAAAALRLVTLLLRLLRRGVAFLAVPPFFSAWALRRIAEFQRFFTAFSERPGKHFAISHQRLPVHRGA